MKITKKRTENTRTSPFVDGSQWVPNPGRKVLDLGCGLGIAGIVAAGLGAEVLLQDRILVEMGWGGWSWGAPGK